MSVLDSFYFLFDSDSSKLDKGLAESEKKTGSLIDKLKGVDDAGGKAGSALLDLVGKTAGVLGVGAAIGALIAGVKESVAAYEALSKLADEFRSTASAMQEFSDVAKVLGLSQDEAKESLKAFDDVMQNAIKGTGGAKQTFKDLGISLTDASGKARSTTDVMSELSTAMQGMDEQKRLDITEKLGLDGPALKMFTAEAGDLQKRISEIGRVSGLNLEEATKRSKEFVKASKGMGTEFDLLKMYLDKVTEKFKIATIPWFTTAMETATKYVRMFTEYLMKHSHFVEGAFIAIGAAIAYFMLPAAISGAVAMWAMIAPFIGIAAAALALGAIFALIYDDVMNFIDGNESMIGSLLDSINSLLDSFPSLKDMIESIEGAFVSAGETIMGVWDAIVAAVKAAIDAVMSGIDAAVSAFGKAKSFLGFGDSDTAGAAASGQKQLAAAGASPLASSSSSSISNSKSSNSTSVNVGKVEVKTQATDAAGISKAIGGSMETQMRQAVSNFDDGVLA